MSPWIAKVVVAVAIVAMFVIRAPHVRRSLSVKVASSRESNVDRLLVVLVSLGVVLPIASIALPWLRFADYTLHTTMLGAGLGCSIASL